jgi:hypothetical protein
MSGRLPPQAIKKWTTIKHELLGVLEKIPSATTMRGRNDPRGAAIAHEDKAELVSEMKKLLVSFDKNLAGHLKTASKSTDDAKAKAALVTSLTILREYRSKARVTADNLQMPTVTSKVTTAIDDLEDACERTLKAMGADGR